MVIENGAFKSSCLNLISLLDFGPRVPESHRSIKYKMFLGAVRVYTKIAHTLKLKTFLWLGRCQTGLYISGNDLKGIGVNELHKVFVLMRIRTFIRKQAVI